MPSLRGRRGAGTRGRDRHDESGIVDGNVSLHAVDLIREENSPDLGGGPMEGNLQPVHVTVIGKVGPGIETADPGLVVALLAQEQARLLVKVNLYQRENRRAPF